MQALVLIAHGSRRQASNEEVEQLASRLRDVASDRYPIIATGFLELASPTIPEAIESCIAAGATKVVVVPYFLAAGRHVVEDIPAFVDPVAEQHPHVQIRIADHIGLSDAMINVILDSASAPSPSSAAAGLQRSA